MLQMLQNMSLKSILRVDKRTSTSDVHTRLGIERLEVRRKIHGYNEMFRVHHHKISPAIYNIFTKELNIDGSVNQEASK